MTGGWILGAIAAGVIVLAGAVSLEAADGVSSGLGKGETVTPFHPMHVAGADRGSRTCPV